MLVDVMEPSKWYTVVSGESDACDYNQASFVWYADYFRTSTHNVIDVPAVMEAANQVWRQVNEK